MAGPGVSDSAGLRWAGECAFLASSEVTLTWLVWEHTRRTTVTACAWLPPLY